VVFKCSFIDGTQKEISLTYWLICPIQEQRELELSSFQKEQNAPKSIRKISQKQSVCAIFFKKVLFVFFLKLTSFLK